MTRLIDAEHLIDCINTVQEMALSIGGKLEAIEPVNEGFISLINSQPTVETKPKWIPVSERLPSESDDYLVTIKFDTETFDTELFYFNAEKTRWLVEERYGEDFFVKNKIIAWMELPKPYRGE